MNETLLDIWNYLTANAPQLITAGVLGFLLDKFITHRLARSRDKESFDRSVTHSQAKENEAVLSVLGVFANGILNCWEEATVWGALSKAGPRHGRFEPPSKIAFPEYSDLKKELIRLAVFDSKVWHSLDKLPGSIERLYSSLESSTKDQMYVHTFHFSEQSKSLWGIVVNEFSARGGDVKTLTCPMPLPTRVEQN